ncbi:hypothetical protein AB4Y43_01190 [Paraburkholderia sp. BR10872]|uniref:hypothetical protein n=1 Tax=Paraburkholderia sp. BR10872 TaxID=3236989 RepID=UPI0034D37FD7
MSGATAALEILRQKGMKVRADRQPVDTRTTLEKFGTVWLIDFEAFSAELSFHKNQPAVTLITHDQLPLRKTYSLASFISVLCRNHDFFAQMVDGSEPRRISLVRVHDLVERAMYYLDDVGIVEAVFQEHPEIPF